MTMSNDPPRLARLLLRLVLDEVEAEIVLGDLEELYVRDVARDRSGARVRYWRGALSSIVVGLAPGRIGSRVGSGLVLDVKQALRRVWKQPGFAVVAAVTLALGIGATAAVLSVIREAVQRPLPGVTAPERLGVVEFVERGDADRRTVLLSEEFAALEAAMPGQLTTTALVGVHVRVDGAPTQAVIGHAALGDYFGTVGVRAAAGRLPGARELSPSADPYRVVISERLWSMLYARDPGVAGRALRVNGRTFVVAGVAGGGFRGTSRGFAVDVWLPTSSLPHLLGGEAEGAARVQYYAQAVVRVPEGGSFAAVRAALADAFAALAAAAPAERELGEHVVRVYEGIGLDPSLRARAATSSALLVGVVSLILVIACANVANLLLFRGVRRRGETAVRRALGASVVRVARQQLTESALLAGLGGVCAVLVAWLVARVLRGSPVVAGQTYDGLALDGSFLASVGVVTVGAFVLFGVLPAVVSSATGDLTLRAASGRATPARGRLRTVITVVQLALSLTLVVGALLLTRTVGNLYAVDLGFRPERVWTAWLQYYPLGLTEAETAATTRRVIAALRRHPDVEAVGGTTSAPFWGLTGALRLISASGADTVAAVRERVTPGYFETIQARLAHGRFFTESDEASAGTPLVITHALATRLFGDPARAPGHHLRAAGASPLGYTVVGVTRDMRTMRPTQEPDVAAYEISRGEAVQTQLAVRVRGGTAQPATLIRNIVRDLLPDAPVEAVALQEALDTRLGPRLLLARLLRLVSAIAVLLAGIGLYAVIAFGVAERTREIGIRMALGARTVGVARLVLAAVARVLGIGIAAGLVGAALLATLLRDLLFGVQPLDALVLASAAAFFACVGVAAALPPLRAAARVDPLVALRRE